MGYGKNLENILNEREMTVRQAANKTNIAATTLYSAIQRDAPISYGNAVKLHNALHPKFDIRSICKDVPADDRSLHGTSLAEYFRVGDKMRAARERAGLEVQELADLMHLDPDDYENYETGSFQPFAELLLNFCGYVHITMEELFSFNGQMSKSLGEFRQLRKLICEGNNDEIVIIIFDGENADKNLEINISHPVLNHLDSCDILFISTAVGKDKEKHIAIGLKDK